MNNQVNATQSGTFRRGDIARHVLLPGILPRFRHLFASGFEHLAVFIASVFLAVRILPPQHRFFQSRIKGSYGVLDVLIEGARHVKWDRDHLDQCLIYFVLLTGYILLIFQFIALLVTLMSGAAIATPLIDRTDDYTFFFVPSTTEQDYALRFLDLVFGLPDFAGTGGFFESCVGRPVPCLYYDGTPLPVSYGAFPSPMHEAIHTIFEFYNYAIIGIAFIIIMYYFVTLMAETAVHGTYLGQRANKLWVPIRVVFFAALIMPVFQGFNVAQVLTLTVAYHSTGMASNGWRAFTTIVNNEMAGNQSRLLAEPPEMPNVAPLAHFMSVVKACKYAEEDINKAVDIQAYIVRDEMAGGNCLVLDDGVTNTLHNTASVFSNREDIIIRFGERAVYAPGSPTGTPGETIPCGTALPTGGTALSDTLSDKYRMEKGYVFPTCGEIVLPQAEVGDGNMRQATRAIARDNYELIREMWIDPDIDQLAKEVVELKLGKRAGLTPSHTPINVIQKVVPLYRQQLATEFENTLNFLSLATPSYFDLEAPLRDCGWVCAALYYNRIAEANGDLYTALQTFPNVNLWPYVMMEVVEQRNFYNSDSDLVDLFNTTLPQRRAVDFTSRDNLKVANITNHMFSLWFIEDLNTYDFSDGGVDMFRPTMGSGSGSAIIDMISSIFGLSGLFDMRQNSDIHPLAQLSMLGKGLVESTIRFFGGAVLGSGANIIPGRGDFSKLTEVMEGPVAGIMFTFGMISLMIGFILFYVLPFLPFLYFIFAVSGWIKAIFEAMVGLPLWALSYLRLDGEGIIGEGAESGWFLILEILLRPILILFSLIASLSLLMAMINVLNELFDFVVANVGGYNAVDRLLVEAGKTVADNPDPYPLEHYRSPIDQFFFTAIYAIIVYMIASSSFKMIDAIPNQILRWLGANLQTFGDFSGDPASGLMEMVGTGVKYMAFLGAMLGSGPRKAAKGDPEAE
jgi:conjugal transfer/type IV secretion protein DotA/TraY